MGSGGKLLLTTGIMGGLSTFSSFICATDQMLANPVEQASAIAYLVLSMVAGFFACGVGSLARWPSGRLRRIQSAGNLSKAKQPG